MKNSTTDLQAIQDNLTALKSLKTRGNELIEYWPRLLPDTYPTTEDYHNWAGNPDYIYQRYRELQLHGMTPAVFDHLPPETQRPELDDPPVQYNPLQVSRYGPGAKQRTPERSKFQPGRYARIASHAATTPRRSTYGNPIIVNHTWLAIEKGCVVIPKDAEKRLKAHFTHVFTPEQMQVGNAMEGMIEGLQSIMAVTGGKVPISNKDGKTIIDMDAIKQI